MPCGDIHDTAYYQGQEIDELRKEVATLTRHLCYLCMTLDPSHSDILKRNPSLYAWWEAHKAEDAKEAQAVQLAVQAEAKRMALRQAGLSKLSPAERQALGLNGPT